MPINPLTGLDEEDEALLADNSQPPTQPSWDPAVKSYLMDKYNPEARQKIVDQNGEYDTAGAISGALASLGAAFQGKDSQAAVNNVFKDRQADKDRKLSEFDKNRAMAIQDVGLQRDEKKFARDEGVQQREDRADSDESKLADKAARKMGYSGPPITATQFKSFSPAMTKIYQVEQARLARQDAIAAALAKKENGSTEGEKAVDKDFAKVYDEWTSTGRSAVDKNLQRLQDAKAALKQDSSLTGPIVGSLPDSIRNLTNERAIQTRDNVRAAAQGALKATLGSQFTEKEGERIMNQAYNEKLSPEANIAKIETAINELQTNRANNESKSKYYQQHRTLAGFNGLSDSIASQSSGMVRMKDPQGNVRLIPADKVDAAKQAGGVLVDGSPSVAGTR